MSKVILQNVRLSFVHVDAPQAIEEGQDKKYSVSVIIPKSDKVNIAKMEKAIKIAMEDGKEKLGKFVASKLKVPLRDGDEDRPEDEAYEDAMFFSASSARKPGIISITAVDMSKEEDYIYSGVYAHVSLNLYAYNTSGIRELLQDSITL